MWLILITIAMSVNVNVINVTEGKTPLSRQWVYLFGFTEKGELKIKDSILTNTRGTATFKLDSGYIYIFQTDYREVPYISEAINLIKDTVVKSVDIEVYEPTVKDDSLVISNGHLVLTSGNGGLFVTEMFSVENTAQRTFTGGFYFVLPPGSGKTFSPAEQGFENEWSVSGDTVFFTGPILPGKRIIAFQYQLKSSGDIKISHRLPIKADYFRVLVLKGLDFKNANLGRVKDMTIGNDVYAVYEGENIDNITFTVKGPGGQSFSWIPFALGILLVLVVALFFLRKRATPEDE